MDLERMTAKVRPRKGWEAIDLGVALVQRHAMALYKIWLLTTLPFFLIATTLLVNYSIWPYLIFWLFKPLWERPMLHFLSRELFGERLSVSACVKAFFSLAKIQWFASLTWRRPSFTRSLDLPIIQLEGLSGNQRSQRLKVIHSLGSGSAVWLTVFFVCLESVFYLAIFALVYLFLPVQMTDSIDLWQWVMGESESPATDFLLNWQMYIAVSLVAPFFTACGFALYLNQRTHLEAWDIELSFKRLAKRLNEYSGQPVKLASWMSVLVFSSWLMPASPLQAAESDPATEPTIEETISHERAKQLIDTVKQDEAFNEKEKSYRYERRFEKKSDNPVTIEPGSWSTLWYLVAKIFALIVEFALWVVLAVILIFLITRYRHLILGLKPPERVKKRRPKKLFGLDMASESLPDKPWLVALSLIEAQQFREATSLLYRASLIWYIDNTAVVIKDGDTELECLRKVSPLGGQSASQYIRRLTEKWRRLAYAHQLPESTALIELCQQWPNVFVNQSETEQG